VKGDNRSPTLVGISWFEAWLGEGKGLKSSEAVKPSLSISAVSATSAALSNQTRCLSIFGLLTFSGPYRSYVDHHGVDIKDLVHAGDG
jgi:hypothetical protein